MKILVACEESQAVTIELRKLGHEAYSCDIIECSGGHCGRIERWSMSNLIDRDALLELMRGTSMLKVFPDWKYLASASKSKVCFYASEVKHIIINAPAIDAEPVRHGEWIEHTEPISWCEDDVDIFFACSICGDTMPCETNYCPSCGAKMDGDKDAAD